MTLLGDEDIKLHQLFQFSIEGFSVGSEAIFINRYQLGGCVTRKENDDWIDPLEKLGEMLFKVCGLIQSFESSSS